MHKSSRGVQISEPSGGWQHEGQRRFSSCVSYRHNTVACGQIYIGKSVWEVLFSIRSAILRTCCSWTVVREKVGSPLNLEHTWTGPCRQVLSCRLMERYYHTTENDMTGSMKWEHISVESSCWQRSSASSVGASSGGISSGSPVCCRRLQGVIKDDPQVFVLCCSLNQTCG